MKILYPQSLHLAGILISIVILVFGLYELQSVIIPLMFSLLLATLLYPICRILEKWRFPRSLAISISLLLMLAVFSGLIYATSVQIISFSEELPVFIDKMNNLGYDIQIYIKKQFHLTPRRQVSELRKYSTDLLKNSGDFITTMLSSTTGTLASVMLVPIYVFFILLYRDFFREFCYRSFGMSKIRTDILLHKLYAVVRGYLTGVFFVILIVALLNSVGLWLLGLDYAFFFGSLAAILLLIPYFGIAIGSLLPIMYSLVTKDSPMHAVGVAAVFAGVQMLESNFITPNIVGSKVSINPLAAMISLLLGGMLWGLAGLILSIPVVAIVKVVCDAVPSLRPYGFLMGEPKTNKYFKEK